MAKKFRSKIAGAMYETVSGLQKAGLVDVRTMREFDRNCLTEVAELSPKAIAALRKREGVSQGVFAQHLNVKPKLVSEWERGEKKPSGPSLKLLALVKAKGLEAILYCNHFIVELRSLGNHSAKVRVNIVATFPVLTFCGAS